MQSRKRVCDVCPNRGECSNRKLKSSGENETIIAGCSFARQHKWDLSKWLMDLAINTNDVNLMCEASQLAARVSTLAISEMKGGNKCLTCSSSGVCPFYSFDTFQNTFLVCPKESAIKPEHFFLRVSQANYKSLKTLALN